MSAKSILITGSSGLIGSECVTYFDAHGWQVHGLDNNMRQTFFGSEGDTRWNLERLKRETKNFQCHALDIRDRQVVLDLVESLKPNAVLHCAAQPSHDLAAKIPLDDFDVNAAGTINLLEATRRSSPEASFVFISTNKVYGDRPNELPLRELETRFDYAEEHQQHGISETTPTDQCLHSIFGASKVAADIMVQEYGRYFGMNTVCFRGGCLTGPSHSGVELHGFLSYLVKCVVHQRPYTIIGYKGKQVRDNIHSYDVCQAIDYYLADPSPGAVYNLGGGKENSVSMIEAIAEITGRTGKSFDHDYLDQPRKGDHICYYSDLRKFQIDYPEWSITRSLDSIFNELVEAEQRRLASTSA